MRRISSPQQSKQSEPIALLMRQQSHKRAHDFLRLRSGSLNGKTTNVYRIICLGLTTIYLFVIGSLIILYQYHHVNFLFSFQKGNSNTPSIRRILNFHYSPNENLYSKISPLPVNETIHSPEVTPISLLHLNKSNNIIYSTVVNNISIQSHAIPKKKMSPLIFPGDYEKFTIRINTWKREEQLNVSIRHYLACSSVGQIQVIWCIEQGEPPVWLIDAANKANEDIRNDVFPYNNSTTYPSLVIERHAVNSLNERFLALNEIPTAAVLSIDDDVIRPCFALDATFVTWTLNPDRQVGFDARSHEIEKSTNNTEIWSYAYMSTTEKSNKYSITLTRFSFLHRDYLTSYWIDMPSEVRDMVSEHFNCEDIAMSLWISANTNGQPPLLADYWAVKSQIKMFVNAKISGGKNHKSLRNHCMDYFADLFMLKGRLRAATLYHRNDHHGGLFEYGTKASNTNSPVGESFMLYNETKKIIEIWKRSDRHVFLKKLSQLTSEASKTVYDYGLIENTPPWKERFSRNSKHKVTSHSFR